jgi:glycosyltransferase involved in cell wall biosynthesis
MPCAKSHSDQHALRIRILAGDLAVVAGSSLYTEQLALRLRALGHSVTVVCFRGTERLKESCEVFELGRSPTRDKSLLWRFAFQFDESHCTRAIGRLPLGQADLAIGLEHMMLRPHARKYPRTPWVYVPLSWIAPVEIESYALRGSAAFFAKRKFHAVQRWSLQRANFTMRFTSKSCDALTAYYDGVLKTPPRYVINDMPIELPAMSVRRVASAPTIRFLTVGRVTDTKNINLCVSALSPFREVAWRYNIIGEGDALGAVKQAIVDHRLEDKVFCHGRQPELDKWYRQADLFLFPSRLDNCPLVVLEAMSYGVPVLGMRPDGIVYQSGIEELVTHRVDGLLAADERDFGLLIGEVLANPDAALALGAEARSIVASRNTWERHVESYLSYAQSAMPTGDKYEIAIR